METKFDFREFDYFVIEEIANDTQLHDLLFYLVNNDIDYSDSLICYLGGLNGLKKYFTAITLYYYKGDLTFKLTNSNPHLKSRKLVMKKTNTKFIVHATGLSAEKN